MSNILSDDTSAEMNGYQNMGMFLKLLDQKKVPTKLWAVAIAIAQRSIGYCRATTNTKDEHGGNRTTGQWANGLDVSKPSFIAHKKELAELGIIKIHKGSQYRNAGGSYSDYYSIIFDREFNIKHKLYFNVGGVKSTKAEVDTEEPQDSEDLNVKDYFINRGGEIHKIYINGKTSMAWKLYMSGLPDGDKVDFEAITPTVEELQKHLDSQPGLW
jgi:flagellar hook protein FlgE